MFLSGSSADEGMWNLGVWKLSWKAQANRTAGYIHVAHLGNAWAMEVPLSAAEIWLAPDAVGLGRRYGRHCCALHASGLKDMPKYPTIMYLPKTIVAVPNIDTLTTL